jgi:hypothetical protein
MQSDVFFDSAPLFASAFEFVVVVCKQNVERRHRSVNAGDVSLQLYFFCYA